MMSKKILTGVLALAMVFSTFTVSFAATDQTPAEPVLISAPVETTAIFTDVTNHWGKEAINKWSGYGIINGYEGLFRPDDSITRGEMAVILDNMMDFQEVAVNSFTDLPAGQFYTQAVLKANAAGIILGDGTTVRPLDKITREESAIMMSRAFDVVNAAATKAFVDADQVSSWAKNAVFGMEAKGYVNGYNGYFEPKANITRAATITMINNIVKAYYTAAGTYTENVTGTAVIKVPGVILKDMNISENLIIAEGVANGNATLDNVDVAGNTVVRGGGVNSIIIIDSNLAGITVSKIDGKVRIVVSGSTTVGEVTIQTGATLEEGTLTAGSTGFGDLVIEAEEGDTIVLIGDFGTVEINTPGVKVDMPEGTTVENLVVNEVAAIIGEGIVENAQVNVSGVTFVTEPENIVLKTGVTAPVIGEEPEVIGGGGGGVVIPPAPSPTLTLDASSVKIGGNTVPVIDGYYQVDIDWTNNTALSAVVSGANFQPATSYPMKVKAVASGGYEVIFNYNVTGAAMNVTNREITELNLIDNLTNANLMDQVNDMIDLWLNSAAVNDTILVTIQNGNTVLFSLNLKVVV